MLLKKINNHPGIKQVYIAFETNEDIKYLLKHFASSGIEMINLFQHVKNYCQDHHYLTYNSRTNKFCISGSPEQTFALDNTVAYLSSHNFEGININIMKEGESISGIIGAVPYKQGEKFLGELTAKFAGL